MYNVYCKLGFRTCKVLPTVGGLLVGLRPDFNGLETGEKRKDR